MIWTKSSYSPIREDAHGWWRHIQHEWCCHLPRGSKEWDNMTTCTTQLSARCPSPLCCTHQPQTLTLKPVMSPPYYYFMSLSLWWIQFEESSHFRCPATPTYLALNTICDILHMLNILTRFKNLPMGFFIITKYFFFKVMLLHISLSICVNDALLIFWCWMLTCWILATLNKISLLSRNIEFINKQKKWSRTEQLCNFIIIISYFWVRRKWQSFWFDAVLSKVKLNWMTVSFRANNDEYIVSWSLIPV